LGERPPAAVRRLASLLYQAGRYAEADRDLADLGGGAAALDTNLKRLDVQALTQLPGGKDRALALAREAVTEANANAVDHVWLAQVLDAVGQPKEALAELERALKLDAKLPDAWVALVRHHALAKQPEEGLKAAERAKAELPPEVAPRVLGLCYEILGRRDLA